MLYYVTLNNYSYYSFLSSLVNINFDQEKDRLIFSGNYLSCNNFNDFIDTVLFLKSLKENSKEENSPIFLKSKEDTFLKSTLEGKIKSIQFKYFKDNISNYYNNINKDTVIRFLKENTTDRVTIDNKLYTAYSCEKGYEYFNKYGTLKPLYIQDCNDYSKIFTNLDRPLRRNDKLVNIPQKRLTITNSIGSIVY